MKTIERLKQLLASASRGKWYQRGIDIHVDTTSDGKPYEGYIGAIAFDRNRDLVIESRNALPALLAVVEAAERLNKSINDGYDARRAGRNSYPESCRVVNDQKVLDAALRALEGGE